jgi:hypothetical protein
VNYLKVSTSSRLSRKTLENIMSNAKLKPIEEQVMVITGASSGIGLATAKLAAKRGAKVVFAARSEASTSQIVTEINQNGAEALFVPCDVSKREQVEEVARQAIEKFGRIDTWVNNAGVSIMHFGTGIGTCEILLSALCCPCGNLTKVMHSFIHNFSAGLPNYSSTSHFDLEARVGIGLIPLPQATRKQVSKSSPMPW